MLKSNVIIENLKDTFESIIFHLNSSRNLFLRSDDEIINMILKTEEDKIAFQKEVDELIRSNRTSKEITINNQKFTISI